MSSSLLIHIVHAIQEPPPLRGEDTSTDALLSTLDHARLLPQNLGSELSEGILDPLLA